MMHQKIRNPFLKTQINSAFEKTSDVEQIHQQLTKRILTTLSHIKAQGSILQLLLGAPGSGKTHLLTRLWRYSAQSLTQNRAEGFLFVSVPPPGDLSKISLHILRELISSLLERFSEDTEELLPLDLLITEILRKVLIQTLSDGQQREMVNNSKPEALYHLLTKSENRAVFITHCTKYFNQVFPSIDVQLYQALFALLDPFRKQYILKWFQGGVLTESETGTLNIGSKFIDEGLALTLSRAIITLSPFPILLALDQLESTFYRFKKEGLIQFIDTTISLLQEKRNLYLLLVVQTQEWLDALRQNLPLYILDRISKIHLIKPLTLNESFALVGKRLEKFHMTTEPIFLNEKMYFPFSHDALTTMYKSSGGNPRQFMNVLRESFEFAVRSNFDPEWEENYRKEIESETNKIFTLSDVYDYLEGLFDQEIRRQEAESSHSTMSYEKMSELWTNIVFSTISESFFILFGKPASSRTLKSNVQEKELLINVKVSNINLKFNQIGIIVANQKNLIQFQAILERSLQITNFQKIIVLRSQKLEALDRVPGITNILNIISNKSFIEFLYLDENIELKIQAYFIFLNNIKDIVVAGKISLTEDIINWFLLNKFINTIEIFPLLFSPLQINTITLRIEKRIERALLTQRGLNLELDKAQIFNLQELSLIRGSDTNGFEFGLLFSYQFEFDDHLHWGVFRGSGNLTLNAVIKKIIADKQIDVDPLGVFAFSGVENITPFLENPISYIVAEFGYDFHFTNQNELEKPIKFSFFTLIKLLKPIFRNIPPNSSMSPKQCIESINNLNNHQNEDNLTPDLVEEFAKMFGPFLNVSFRNGLIYSLTKEQGSISSEMETVRERSIVEGMNQALKPNDKDSLQLAEERGELQKLFDENVIDLTNRVLKFNMFIDPEDYDLLTAVLNYAKLSPDNLTPLIRSLISEFGPSAQRKSVNLSLEQIINHILANYQPFKNEWLKLKQMPPLIRSLGTNLQLMGYMLNAFTLLDFHSLELDQKWYNLISKTTSAFIKSNIEIQQLSESYYQQKFEPNTKTTLLPVVNRYQNLIIEEYNKIEQKYKRANDELAGKNNDLVILTRNIVEWWFILEAFNRIVSFEFHLDTVPFMDEIFQRFQFQFEKQPINYISTKPLTYTLFFKNALELMTVDNDKLTIVHKTRSNLSLIQADLYEKLLEKKQIKNESEKLIDDLSYWTLFYLLQSENPSRSIEMVNTLASQVVSSLQLKQNMLNRFSILLQIIAPNIVFTKIEETKIEIFILGYLISHLFSKDLKNYELKSMFHKLEMLLIVPNQESEAFNHTGTEIDYPLIQAKLGIPKYPVFKKYEKKIKINTNYITSVATSLNYIFVTKKVQLLMNTIGLETIDIKKAESVSKYILRGSEDANNQNPLELFITVNNEIKGTSIRFEFKWDKNSPIAKSNIVLIISIVVASILLDEEMKKLQDKAFVMYCAVCGYQINLIKNKASHLLFPCNKCGIANIIHPEVYKIMNAFIK